MNLKKTNGERRRISFRWIEKVIRSYVRASVSCDCTATANNAISKTRSMGRFFTIDCKLGSERERESEDATWRGYLQLKFGGVSI